MILRSSDDDQDYRLSAAEVARIEEARYQRWAAGHERARPGAAEASEAARSMSNARSASGST